MADVSTKPYFLRAIYEWCSDCGFTPYLSVRVDAVVRHMALATLLDRPEHRRPRVVARERELGIRPAEPEEELGIALIQATDPVADEGSDGGLIHTCPPGERATRTTTLIERSF